MANFIVDFMFGPEKDDSISKVGGGDKDALKGLIEASPYATMSEADYEDALKKKLAEVKYYRYAKDVDEQGVPLPNSVENARALAALALDRGVPMYPPGPEGIYTQQQYLDTLAQQPPTNKLYTPEEDALARQQFAQRMAMFKNQMAGFNKLYPNVNAMARSPYDALVFGPANNPAPFNAGPSQGEVGYPSNRFQARRIGR